jgi:hypothetical protein
VWKRDRAFRFRTLPGLLASFLVVLCFNSLLFVKSKAPYRKTVPLPLLKTRFTSSIRHLKQTRSKLFQIPMPYQGGWHNCTPANKKIENELVEVIAIYELVEEEPFEAAGILFRFLMMVQTILFLPKKNSRSPKRWKPPKKC